MDQTSSQDQEKSSKKMPVVDQAKCIGCGLCISTCPDVFEFNNDGKSQVKDGADCQKVNCCQAAMDVCPADAISWQEESKS